MNIISGMDKKGLVHIYTGDGKGKTTAAVGLAVRAVGHGKRVLFYQFLKPKSIKSGERLTFSQYNLPIDVQLLDCQWDMAKSLDEPTQVSQAKNQIKKTIHNLTNTASKDTYDMIILDEIIFCLSKQLADITDIENLLKNRSFIPLQHLPWGNEK